MGKLPNQKERRAQEKERRALAGKTPQPRAPKQAEVKEPGGGVGIPGEEDPEEPVQ